MTAEEARVPQMRPDGFHGLVGHATHLFHGVSEASSEAIALQLVVAAGVIMGPKPWIDLAGSRQHAKVFAIVCGDTALGRKGTSWSAVQTLLEPAAPGFLASGRLATGPASGEGIVAMTRPSSREPGPFDGHLLILATEFASVTTAASRAGSSLSPTLRNAWDNVPLQVGTKHDHADFYVQNHHIGMIGHITPQELRRSVRPTDIDSGLMNRFLYAHVERRERLPRPAPLDRKAAQLISHDLGESLAWARQQGRIPTSREADDYWHTHVYDRYDPGVPRYEGVMRELTARVFGQIRRLALIFALLDRSAVVHAHHLRAAVAMWEYSEESMLRLFTTPAQGDRRADKLLDAVRRAGPSGLTGRQQHACFHGHMSAGDLERVIRQLQHRGLVQVRSEPPSSGRGTGRPTRRLVAREHISTYDPDAT